MVRKCNPSLVRPSNPVVFFLVGGTPVMKFRYYIDPATDLPHIYCHEVSESEVEVALSRQEKTGPVGTERGSRLDRHLAHDS